MQYTNPATFEITVAEKHPEIKNNQTFYVVLDSDGNAYKIDDLLLLGKFNSTDLYAKLEVGKAYRIETTGYRIRFLSEYPNINKIELLE